MVKLKYLILSSLIIFFLSFSFYPTYYELSRKDSLVDQNREFILEHNFYWPDFNLYLSKIRQGYEGRWTALERYTSEPHRGSLIQVFYIVLGQAGRMLNVEPNYAYQLGRILLSPLLLIIVYKFCKFFFPKLSWAIWAILIILVSGSFPRFYTDSSGALQIGRYMEWWSNIDALQRITFIPHILFGQVVSLYLLFQITYNPSTSLRIGIKHISKKKFTLYLVLGNIAGLVFPPSLITLNGVLVMIIAVKTAKKIIHGYSDNNFKNYVICNMLYVVFTLPSLFYFMILTRQIPWSALVEAHRLHPMMIPLDQYVLGVGPVFILGFLGMIISIINRDKKYRPLIFWIISTLLFAAFFSVFRDQSPLRFTQTGLFIPLGILATYFFYQFSNIGYLRYLGYLAVFIYFLENLFIMKTSFDWQISFVDQRVSAVRPPVPYPPQTLYPLKSWMDAVRWLGKNTDHDEVVLAEMSAANFIPAYAGNTVYFGQTNTVAYELKQQQVDQFFSGKMTASQAELLIRQGRISYVFYSFQEKDKAGWVDLTTVYPFLNPVYTNPTVTIYKIASSV